VGSPRDMSRSKPDVTVRTDRGRLPTRMCQARVTGAEACDCDSLTPDGGEDDGHSCADDFTTREIFH
jgi:hypothetical protein